METSEDRLIEEVVTNALARYIRYGTLPLQDSDYRKECLNLIYSYDILLASKELEIAPWKVTGEEPNVKKWADIALRIVRAKQLVEILEREMEQNRYQETVETLTSINKMITSVDRRLSNPLISYIEPTEDGGFVEYRTKINKHKSLMGNSQSVSNQ